MMRSLLFVRYVVLLALVASGAVAVTGPRTALVDPFIGTSGGGNVFPGPVAPFGMVQFSPDTRAPSIGYGYDDQRILGFSMTHMSGVGCDDYGDVFLTATSGPLGEALGAYASSGQHGDQLSSPFRHETEQAEPGYYRVRLDRWDTDVELTATERAGMVRFRFPAGREGNVIVPISHTLTRTYAAQARLIGKDEIAGYVTSQAFCDANQRITVHFVMQFNQPYTGRKTFATGFEPKSDTEVTQAEEDKPVGVAVTFPAGRKEPVIARIGISFVDEAGARRNLASEIRTWDFDAVRARTRAAWERELRAIDVDGGAPEQQKCFYTALYHCLLMPSIFSDVDGRYIGFDGKIHTAAKGRDQYANYSGWDIYRNEASLLTLLQPKRMEDMCQSIVDMYTQGGWIDRWPQANVYTNVMIGSPLTSMIATAWNAGLRNFDMATAYKGMWLDATQEPPGGKPYRGEQGVEWVDRIGYLPYDKVDHAVSRTEEDAYAYSALASIADSLGRTEDARRMRRRSLSYRPLWDAETGFLRPKSSDGKWLSPFDPTRNDWGQYTEGTAWEYLWLAPHDVSGLIRLMGGDEKFNARLDEFFTGNHYDPYNEPDLQAPFLYDYSRAPWKTQDLVRNLLARVYSTKPNGIPGNDDCGTMSAWYIFSALGFYPVDPARPAFETCSPVFRKAVLHLPKPYRSREFTVEAPDASGENRYIQSATLNGRPLDASWFPENAILDGERLTVRLGPEPNTNWGAADAARPPSVSRQSSVNSPQ